MFGSGNIILVNNPAKSSPATVVGMQNGLSLIGTNGELGLNPLLHDTDLNLDGFIFTAKDAFANNCFVLDTVNNIFVLGFSFAPGSNSKGLNLSINDNAFVEQLTVYDDYGSFLFLDATNKQYTIGGIGGLSNGTQMHINDSATSMEFVFGAGIKMLWLDGLNHFYSLGDINNTNGGVYLNIIDDPFTGNFDFLKNTGSLFNIDANGGIKTAEPSPNGAGRYRLGKVLAGAVVFDATQYIEVVIDTNTYKIAIAN